MRPWIALAGLATALTLWPVSALDADRALLGGAPWRLWTGPLRHADLGHLARDLAGLLGLAALLRGRMGHRATALLVGLGLPLPVLGALAGDPTLGGYLGLSGLVHGLCAVALLDLAASRPRWALALGGLLAGKLAFEAVSGHLLVPMSGHRPAVWGHVAGAAVGLLVGLDARLSGRRGSGDTQPTSGSRRCVASASPAPLRSPSGSLRAAP